MDPVLQENIERVYKKPLPNNPNLTYGHALNPNELLLYSIGTIDTLKDKEIQAGRLTQERYDAIVSKLPEMQEKIDAYNIAPISYSLQEKRPDVVESQRRQDERREEYRINAGLRGNYPDNYVPFESGVPRSFLRNQKIASYGIDPENPYQFESRDQEKNFYTSLAFAPRKLSKDNIQFILDNNNIKGDLKYLNPLNPSEGFRFKPEGSETYQILREPGFTGHDFLAGMGRELPAIGGDLAGVVATGVRGLGAKGVMSAVYQTLKAGFGAGVGATSGDFVRLLVGKELGYNNLTYEAMFDEAAVTGLWSVGGTVAMGTFMSAVPTAYRIMSGKQISPDILEQIQKVVNRQTDVLRQQGKSGVIYGADNVATAKEINEQIDLFVKKYKKEIGEYNPTLSGRNPLDQDAADLEHIWLKNANDKELQGLYNQMRDGNQSVISNLVRALGDEFADGYVPVGVQVSGEITEEAAGKLARFELEGRAVLNNLIKSFDDNIPKPTGSVFTKTTQDGVEILPKVATNLSKIKDDYLKTAQNNFNKVINDPKYTEFTTGAGYTRKFGLEYYGLKNEGKNLFKRKDVIKEIEDTLGISKNNQNLLKRLIGQSTEGSAVFKNPEFSVKELFELQVVLNEMRVGSKISGSRKFASDAITAVQKQIDKSITDEVAKRLGLTVKTSYNKSEQSAIRKYRKDNDFGDDLTRSYVDMNQAYSDVDNVVFAQLLKSNAPEQLIPAMLNTNIKGAKINTPVQDFMKVLKFAGDDGTHYVQKEVLDYINRVVLDPDLTVRAQKEALNTFLKNNKPTLTAIFGESDTLGRGLFNSSDVARANKRINEIDKQIDILRNTFGVDSNSVNPVYDIVNNIIRASDETISTGALANDIDFLLKTIDDSPELQKQVSALTKNIILRDVMQLDQTGVEGAFRLNPEALNNILYGKFGPKELTGPRLTFDDTLGKLLGSDKEETVEILKLINGLTQREMARDTISDTLTQALKREETSKPLAGFKFLQRMFIPPLTQKGRRITALDVLMTKRSEAFIGRLLRDPDLARQTIAFAEGRRSVQNFANFLAAYGTVYYNDMANELKYYDAEMKKQKINNTELDIEQEKIIDDLIDEYRRE